jgi:hypothetical protein
MGVGAGVAAPIEVSTFANNPVGMLAVAGLANHLHDLVPEQARDGVIQQELAPRTVVIDHITQA